MNTRIIPILFLAYFFCGTALLQSQETTVSAPHEEKVTPSTTEIKTEKTKKETKKDVNKEVNKKAKKEMKKEVSETPKSAEKSNIKTPSPKTEIANTKKAKPVTIKIIANVQKKEAQLEKSRAKLSVAKAKLEKERLEGTLPGDYIASREAKFLKEEKRLNDLAKAIAASKNNPQIEK